MTNSIELVSEMFTLEIVPTRVVPDEGIVDFTQVLTFDSSVGAGRLVRERCRLRRLDFHVLLGLVRKHIGANAPHKVTGRSGGFCALEGDFQFELVQGIVHSWSAGHIGMQWLIYCGPPDRGHKTIYVGCEGEVAVPKLLFWIDQLERLYESVGRVDFVR